MMIQPAFLYPGSRFCINIGTTTLTLLFTLIAGGITMGGFSTHTSTGVRHQLSGGVRSYHGGVPQGEEALWW